MDGMEDSLLFRLLAVSMIHYVRPQQVSSTTSNSDIELQFFLGCRIQICFSKGYIPMISKGVLSESGLYLSLGSGSGQYINPDSRFWL